MPDLTNKTDFCGAMVPAISPQGHTLGVVIVKATYEIDSQGTLSLAVEQSDILYADEMADDGRAIRVPSDFVDRKPGAEVIVVPPVRTVRDSLYANQQLAVRFGTLVFAGKIEDKWPFGPIGRLEEPRRTYAGTYDDAWQRERMPLLPLDFDARYHLAAPAGQLLGAYARGDEELALANFYGERRIEARLPGAAVVVSTNVLGDYFTRIADLDTIIIWSDVARLQLVWRLAIRPRQKLEEIGDVFVDAVDLRAARELFSAT